MSVIASASKDIKFHQWPEGILSQIYIPQSREGYIQSISWGKDGSWVVLVPDSGPTEIISIKDNIKVLQAIQEVYRPSCASFHSTTKKLVGIGTVCGQVMIYDIKGKVIKKRFPRVSTKINSLHYNAPDTHMAATCNNGEILLLSNTYGNISTIYKVPNSNSVTSAIFHRTKRNLFAAGSEAGIVAIWDTNTNHVLCNLQAHQAPVSSIAFAPLRADLLATGGLDRKFGFYDITTKKLVIEVEVHNAVTALDFSDCGLYLGVGYQNGNIAIYDTRAFNNPLSIFEAHEGSGIRHLSFQKVLTNSTQNNSVFDITVEELPFERHDSGDRLSHNASLFDSIGIVGYDDSNLQTRDLPAHKPSEELGDSFMIAMGLDGSNQSDCAKNECSGNDYRKLLEPTKHCTFQNSNTRRSSLLTPALKMASTPKYMDMKLPDAVESPIFITNPTEARTNQAQHSQHNYISSDELKTTIKEIVRQEVKDIVRQEVRDIVRHEVKTQLDSLKSSFKSEFTDMLCQVRRYFLDLQMSIIKEFVNMETLLDKQSTPRSSDFVCNDILLNQNNLLQQEIEKIEKEQCHNRKY